MDFLSTAVGYISAAFTENKKVKEFRDDFASAFISWIRPIFLNEDPKLVEALETSPENDRIQGRLETRLEDLLKDNAFRKQLEEWMQKPGSDRLLGKNIFTAKNIEADSINIGDAKSGSGDLNKNILVIEDSKFRGDINVGDGHKR